MSATTPPARPLLRLAFAAPLSVVAGLLLVTAYPALAWWPMAFPAVALALLTLIGRRFWSAVLVGLLFGIAFFSVNLLFTARYLGPIPWAALFMLEALLTAVFAVPLALAYRWMPRIAPGAVGRTLVLPALVAGLWVLREQIVGSWPYSGFPWGRIGVSQVNGPFAEVASWAGMSGLSFLIVLLCAMVIELVRRRRLRRGLVAAPAAVLLVALLVLPQFPTTAAGSLRVGAVQGNGPAGYFDQRARNAVLNAQLAASAPLFGQQMDVLLWPEGGVDSDPTANSATSAVLEELSRRVDAPLLISAVTERGPELFNSALLWTSEGQSATTYDKRHPVPFGEYVPDRAFWEPFAPDLIGLIGREYTPGTATPLIDLNGVGVGLAICFDVIYDDVVWDGAEAGAQVYMFQTNNADFRGTDENLQQLAFAQMRAIETGRAVVNLSTVGTSQVIAPDGSTLDALPIDTAGHMLTDVPLRTGLTPAVVLGPAVKIVLGWGSLAGLLAVGLLVAVRARRTKRTPTPEGAGV
ncbi:apolipoprotein N-acyltransferase [Microbacterium sp. ru370.1]|uniref:apolipoprotein N-acyltransferase n=1 Tax=unclassified Microbacterium TaxID=2609290 RepID=UPI00088C2D39|nr:MULTISPECIES: apolipoprotein N-acyltransferase [unclassified Microbacterium]SDO74052.1 apolipoprotein N-acyltransferase [Microbacterium sp. ru370.1]SIT88004.1 apolipoprotein N-acyltransferase [Microbacterium sp. RU1D]